MVGTEYIGICHPHALRTISLSISILHWYGTFITINEPMSISYY